jgi:hypothetical protein
MCHCLAIICHYLAAIHMCGQPSGYHLLQWPQQMRVQSQRSPLVFIFLSLPVLLCTLLIKEARENYQKGHQNKRVFMHFLCNQNQLFQIPPSK